MKIKEIRAKNFAKFTDFELVLNDKVTPLIGMNGSGKTTILTLLWAGFKGIAEKSSTDQLIGERFRFISDDAKSLDIGILLYDELTGNEIRLKRHITKTLNQLSFKSKDGRELSKDYIENLFNVTFLSASHFTSLTGKEQVLALGINVDEFDKKLVDKKSNAALLRKELKNIGEVGRVDEVERVNISQLLINRDNQLGFNSVQINAIARQAELLEAVRDAEGEIKKHQDLIKEWIKESDEIEVKPVYDISIIDAQINNADRVNNQANLYEQYIKDKEKQSSAVINLEENIKDQDTILFNRLKYIKSRSFGMPGLTIDDEGQLVLNDKPIRSPYFSKGELEMIVAQISAGLNPELKVRFIDDFEMLDDINQKKIITKLSEKGFQIITAEVGDEKKGDNTVLLRECKIVKE